MGHISFSKPGFLTVVASLLFAASASAQGGGRSALERVVDEAILPIMEEYDVPGMAVAITVRGIPHFFNYGVASKESGREVTEDTIFEIGSVSKTFTAILAAYAQARGALSLSDSASEYLPALAGSSFDEISLLDLGTYAPGGLPLQFPNTVTNREEMIAYYQNWRPAYVPGTHRLYSNPSIGLFGHLAARSMGESFDDLMEERLIPMLGLTSTYIRVPEARMDDYAQGYSRDDQLVRVMPGVLDSEAYGVKTTAADMIGFLEANMDSPGMDEALQQAIATTHTGYFKVGELIQGLGWEIYPLPIHLDQLLAGNSRQMVFEANEVTRFDPPLPPQENMLFNKTGSTNGFGAYAAFAPAREIGIVILANRNYPVPARIEAAYQIMSALDSRI